MLIIKVELHPSTGGKKSKISEMKIVNTGDCKYSPLLGNYDITIDGKEKIRIENHNRTEDVWELIKKVLNIRK